MSNDFTISIGGWDTQKAAAQAVRYDVFVVEQQVPIELEWDDMDAVSMHVIGTDPDGHAVATARLLPDGHIGRMAVLKSRRGHGIGSAMLQALVACARQRGDSAVMLNAQIHAEPFYHRHGFMREGEEFMEAGIPHVHMRMALEAG